MGSGQSSHEKQGDEKGQSFYQRYKEKKRGPGPSDEDLQKYLGKSREEIKAWAENRPGVGKNQLSGSITAGETSGLGGVAAADGLGGWGRDAEPGNAETRGLKYPPQKPAETK
jgi:hypothetical protein